MSDSYSLIHETKFCNTLIYLLEIKTDYSYYKSKCRLYPKNKLIFHGLMVEDLHFKYLSEHRLMQKVCVEFVSNINTVEDRSIYRDKYRESLIQIYGY